MSVDSQRLPTSGAIAFEDAETSLQPAAAARSVLANLTVERVLWASLIVIAALTRFWNLGHKALHHDESLHAYYSWQWAKGGTYTHDPLMHGPLLFFLNAFVYLVFGATDATSRYAPAFCGVIIVALPWFLRERQFLGRWGALSTSALLLISPTIWYQSRYLRHDVYTVAGAFMMFICLVRYIDRPARKWLVTLAVTTAMMLANHEIIVAVIVLMASFLYLALMTERLRSWYADSRELVFSILALHVFALVAMAGLVLLMPKTYMDRFLDIPWQNPTRQQQIDYYKDMATNWLIVGLLAVVAFFIVALVYLMRSHKRISEDESGWLTSAPEHSVGSSLRSLAGDSTGALIAIAGFVFTFVFLFTSIFTNWYGLFSSTISTDGTYLYWLAQHDVRRGEQPWFYFLLLLPQYEFLPITIGAGLALLTAWRGFRNLFWGTDPGPNMMFRLFLGYWFFGIFAVLSWAGEKMPWLIVHIALPGTILAGVVFGRVIERLIAFAQRGKLGWSDAAIWGGMMISVVAWFLIAARLTYGNFDGDCAPTAGANTGCRAVTAADQNIWWVMIIPPVIFLLLLGYGLLKRGWRQTAMVGLAAAILVLALLEVRVGWRLSFTNPDVPVEMMVYTQTSPDVKQAVTESITLSNELQPSADGEILFDASGEGLAWPLWWYFRNEPDAHSFGGTVLSSDTNAAVIFILTSSANSPENAAVLSNYTGVEHPFRWHFPEEQYRFWAIAPELNPGRSAWMSASDPHGPLDIIRSAAESTAVLFSAQGQAEAFRLVTYRDLNDNLGYFSFTLLVRNDLLPEWGQIRY